MDHYTLTIAINEPLHVQIAVQLLQSLMITWIVASCRHVWARKRVIESICSYLRFLSDMLVIFVKYGGLHVKNVPKIESRSESQFSLHITDADEDIHMCLQSFLSLQSW
jgi:hypothetical protein